MKPIIALLFLSTCLLAEDNPKPPGGWFGDHVLASPMIAIRGGEYDRKSGFTAYKWETLKLELNREPIVKKLENGRWEISFRP